MARSWPGAIQSIEVRGIRRLSGGRPPAGEQAARSPFSALQQRLGRKKVSEKMMREVPVAYLVFDVLYAGGELLMERPLRERERFSTNCWQLQGISDEPQQAKGRHRQLLSSANEVSCTYCTGHPRPGVSGYVSPRNSINSSKPHRRAATKA